MRQHHMCVTIVIGERICTLQLVWMCIVIAVAVPSITSYLIVTVCESVNAIVEQVAFVVERAQGTFPLLERVDRVQHPTNPPYGDVVFCRIVELLEELFMSDCFYCRLLNTLCLLCRFE